MTTRDERRQPSQERGDQRPEWRGVPTPRHWAPRGIGTGVFLGSPKSAKELARITEYELKRISSDLDAELRRIGRFVDADGFYKDGVVVNSEGNVIIVTNTGGVVTVLDVDTTETDIVSSSALTTIYDGTIEGGIMGPNGIVELSMFSDYLNSSGSSRGLQFQVQLGGNTVYDYTTTSTFHGSTALRRVNAMCVSLLNTGSESANLLYVEFEQSPATVKGTVTTGLGGYRDSSPSASLGFVASSGPITEDMSADKNLTVKIAHSASNASLSFRQQYSVLRKTA